MGKHQCCIKVSDPRGWHSYPCSKSATIEVDGKWYCGIHNPAKVAERRARAIEKFERESNFRIAERIASRACMTINPDNPRAVAESVEDMYKACKSVLADETNLYIQRAKAALFDLAPGIKHSLEQAITKAEERL